MPMVALTGHFDGKVIVPDEPVDLPRNQQLIVHVHPVGAGQAAGGGVEGSSLLEFAGMISQQDLRAMTQAIQEGCGP